MEPYDGLVDENPFDSARKSAVFGSFNAVVDLRYESRKLELITPISRAMKEGDIVEVMVTNEQDTRDSMAVDKVGVLGFITIETAGIIAVGDKVARGEDRIGVVAGFDDSHMPNHYNLVIEGDNARSGVQREFSVGEFITIGESRGK